MCAAISSQLFKVNNQIKCDRDISNIEHEMFADEKKLHETTNVDCIAVTYNLDKTLANDRFVTIIKSSSEEIQRNERINNAEDNQSTVKQIALAVEFMQDGISPMNLQPFSNNSSIKNENPLISAISTKSLFEIFVSIQYATLVSDKVTVLFDKKREYLQNIFESISQSNAKVTTTCPSAYSFCTQIIFDSADFLSAFHLLATAFSDNTAPWKIRTCYIQDTLRTKFLSCFESLLKEGRLLDDDQKVELGNVLQKSQQYDAIVFQSKDKTATYLVGVTKKHIDTDLCVLVNFFRTPKEAVSLVHSTDKTNSISLWTESISLAYDIADKLEAENIWINSNGLLNSEIPFTFGTGQEKRIYGSKLGVAQMLNASKKPVDGDSFPTYSSAKIVPGKYNFQTTSLARPKPHVFDDSAKKLVNVELKNLIDVTEANTFKTICFPFGHIFAN